MWTSRGLLTGALALALLLGATNAWGQGRRMGPGRGHGWMRAVKSLDLSTDQIQKISQARASMVSKIAPVRAQIDVKRAELRALWQAKSPSRRAIIAKHNEIDALHRQVRDARIDFKLRVYSFLTPQQRSKVQQAAAKRGGWGRGRGGPGRGRGPGPGRGGGPRRGRGGG